MTPDLRLLISASLVPLSLLAGCGGATSGDPGLDAGDRGDGGGGGDDGGGDGGGGGDVTPPPVEPDPGKQWTLSFAEEFDGSTLDTSKLTPCFDWNGGDCTASFNQGREKYAASQIRLSGGQAAMVAEPAPSPIADGGCLGGQCTYLSGLLSTARPLASADDYLFTFTYGYVEGRMRFPATQGFFTAFWMLPASPDYSYATEIDIVEILGDAPETLWMHYHYADRSEYHRVNGDGNDNGACALRDYSTDFVRFGLDWQPDHIAWYVDGVECGRFEGAPGDIESGPMQLILNLMVDVQWQRDTGVASTDLTQVRQIDVDYIRVFQQE